MLITGKNDEGKTNIINALKLIDAATKVIKKKNQEIFLDQTQYWKLLKQDTENMLIGRMTHNYEETIAEIHAQFEGYFSISVYVDPTLDIIYADYDGGIPADAQDIFGFIPPLGPLSEREEMIGKVHYLRACLNSSIAPRHLRNHLMQTLTSQEVSLVKEIIKTSWKNVELLDCERDYQGNRINYYYKEGRIEREIAWAGQGLQVWFQIITHLVRLLYTSVLILDEPEINLHPEKQNDLIRIIKEYYSGSVLIATHSVELMNNVSVSHIIHVQKRQRQPQIKSTDDRAFLELVRERVGSNFNLIASQFQDFDIIIFTEGSNDFAIVKDLADKYQIHGEVFNIPIHGFSEYQKAIYFKDAYEQLIGKHPKYTLVLDRDYYPEEYLREVMNKLDKNGIRTVFTPGKELENLFLSQKVIDTLFTDESRERFSIFWDDVFESEHLECYATYMKLHNEFLDPKIDNKSVTTKYTPLFEKKWNKKSIRFQMISGKRALHKLRQFYRNEFKNNLSQKTLINTLVESNESYIRRFVNKIYHVK